MWKSQHCNNALVLLVYTIDLEPIGTGQLEGTVLNLGFCRGQIIYENKKVRWRTRFSEGKMIGSSFHSILYHIYKQIKVPMIIIQYSNRLRAG